MSQPPANALGFLCNCIIRGGIGVRRQGNAACRKEGKKNRKRGGFFFLKGGVERETGNMIKLSQALSARLFSVQLGCWLALLV